MRNRKEVIAENLARIERENYVDPSMIIYPEREHYTDVKGPDKSLDELAKSFRCETCEHRKYCPDSYTPAADECDDDYSLDLEYTADIFRAGRKALPNHKRRPRPV